MHDERWATSSKLESRLGRPSVGRTWSAVAALAPALLATACFPGPMGGKLIEAEAFGAAFLFALIIALVPGGVVGGIVVAVAAARRRSRAAGTAGAAPERSALGHLGLLWLKTTMGIAIGVALAVLLVAGVSPHLESRIGYPYSALVSAGLFALYLAVALYALSRPARERRLYLKIPGIVAAVLLLPGLVLWLIAALFGRG